MQSVWTCRGEAFGYLTGRNLRTFDGFHVGCLIDGELYSSDGSYLGELIRVRRLIFDLSKKGKRGKPFKPFAKKPPLLRFANFAAVKIPTGFKDFPSAFSFNRQIERKRVEDLLEGYINSAP